MEEVLLSNTVNFFVLLIKHIIKHIYTLVYASYIYLAIISAEMKARDN